MVTRSQWWGWSSSKCFPLRRPRHFTVATPIVPPRSCFFHFYFLHFTPHVFRLCLGDVADMAAAVQVQQVFYESSRLGRAMASPHNPSTTRSARTSRRAAPSPRGADAASVFSAPSSHPPTPRFFPAAHQTQAAKPLPLPPPHPPSFKSL